jgi:hypothetical protein
VIRFRWYPKKPDKYSAWDTYWGVQLWGHKAHGLKNPYKWTLDIYLGKRILVIIFGRRY